MISRSILSALAGSLPQPVVEAAAGEPFAQAGVDQRLVERRRRRADQDVLQNVEGKRRLDVDDLVEHPVHRDHGFLGRLLRRLVGFAGRIGALEALGRRKARLQRHLGIDLDAVELAEPAVEQAQPLVGVVVAVEEQLGVGRVIVPLVEVLELLIGEIRNVFRIAARIEPVGDVRIERLLRQLVQHAVGG